MSVAAPDPPSVPWSQVAIEHGVDPNDPHARCLLVRLEIDKKGEQGFCMDPLCPSNKDAPLCRSCNYPGRMHPVAHKCTVEDWANHPFMAGRKDHDEHCVHGGCDAFEPVVVE